MLLPLHSISFQPTRGQVNPFFPVPPRERDFFRRLGPVIGIWRLPQVQHAAPSTGRLSCRPEAFLSLVQYILYIGLSCIQSLQPVVVQVCPYFTPLCHKADETALSRVPNLQKLSLPQACQVPHPGPVAFDVCCTIGAVCVSLHAFSRAEMTGISYDTSLLHTP